ncbi:MAG: toll/interleukin-1 receptor domain-containing protein [Candidatus Sulfotelmatobacter sp.]
MATLREYFDADFSYAARLHVSVPGWEHSLEVALLYDFSAFIAFVTCFVPGKHSVDYLVGLLNAFQPGKSQVNLRGKVTLPAGRFFPGTLEVKNVNPFEVRARFHGDPEWTSINEIKTSKRLFIYSESTLSKEEILLLKQKGRELDLNVQFRSTDHAQERSRLEAPLAFISHDSRDKEIAKKIAMQLQRQLCPVWYDEFSLRVGMNLRDSIEAGLKKCSKVILLLSRNFFSNGGWTKKEFDSVFIREILEQHQIVLPVWLGLNKEEVYDYSPSLLNVKGLDWDRLGEQEVCRQLVLVLLDTERT